MHEDGRVFDFPADAPIIRFLDKRGLGEVTYDPSEGIAFSEDHAYLLPAFVKAVDFQQHAVLSAIRSARARHPNWPPVVAHTSFGHVLLYPFRSVPTTHSALRSLVRALDRQRSLFATLLIRGAVTFVPINFTQAEDGFEPTHYGRDALIEALPVEAPAATAAALSELPDARPDAESAEFEAHNLGFTLAAGTSNALAAAGMIAVFTVQALMVRQIGKLFGVNWDKRAYSEFATALGAGTLMRTAPTLSVRQLVKLNRVCGQTAGTVATQ